MDLETFGKKKKKKKRGDALDDNADNKENDGKKAILQFSSPPFQPFPMILTN